MIIARRFIDAAGAGQSQPLFFECDDKEVYLLKFNGPNMARLLFNELIAYRLAKILKLPIPDAEVIQIPPILFGTEKALWGRSDQIVFGSKRTKFANNLDSNRRYIIPWVNFFKGIANAKQVADILVFDMWIRNLDRAGIGKNYGNLLLAPTKKIYIIDHGHALGGVDATPQRQKNLEEPFSAYWVDGPLSKVLSNYVRLDNGSNPFQGVISNISSIGYNEIQTIVEEAASYWPVDPAEVKLVCDFLDQRRNGLQQMLDHLVFDREYFLYYKGEQLSWI